MGSASQRKFIDNQGVDAEGDIGMPDQREGWVKTLMDAGASLFTAVHLACWGGNQSYETSRMLKSAHYEPAVIKIRQLLEQRAPLEAIKQALVQLQDIVDNPILYANAACASSTRRPQ
jgi:hypothetical protein